MQIQNSIALVTGANRGIGCALVNALLQAGAKKVYAGARDLSSLNTAKFIDMTRVVPISIDITNREGVRALPDKVPDVNLLINNAGYWILATSCPRLHPRTSPRQWLPALPQARKTSFRMPCRPVFMRHGKRIINPSRNNLPLCNFAAQRARRSNI